MTGSSFFSRASRVRLRPNWSSTSEPLGPWPRRSGRCPLLGALLALVARQQLDDLLAHAAQVGAQLDEHLGGDALALADEAEQDVLGADVVVAELQRLAQRQLEHLLGARRERDVAARRRPTLADDLLDLVAHGLERDAERLERLGRDAFALVDQAEEDVLGADVVVVEEPRFFLGEDDDPAGSVSKAFEQSDTASQDGRWCRLSLLAWLGNRCPCSCGRRWVVPDRFCRSSSPAPFPDSTVRAYRTYRRGP